MTTPFTDGLGTAERLVDDWEASLQRRAAQANRLAAAVVNLQVTVELYDGAVKASMDPSGSLTALELGNAVRTWPPRRIADAVLAGKKCTPAGDRKAAG